MSARSLLNVTYQFMVANLDSDEQSEFDRELNLSIQASRKQRLDMLGSLGEIGGSI